MSNSLKQSPLTYFHGLDGLRFLAFLVVLGSHLTHPLSVRYSDGLLGYVLSWFEYGYLAVDLFFVLSAFLISWWGIKEARRAGRFHFRRYFVRRALRIWPLYFLMVLISLLVIQLQTATGLPESPMPPLWRYLTFTLNFAALTHDQFLMVILWSISVEEQFYILNGLLLRFGSRFFLPVNIAALVVSIGFRLMYLDEPLTLHYHSVSVMACFAVGNMLAWAVHNPRWSDQLKQFFSGKQANFPLWLLIAALVFYPVLAEYKWIYALEKLWVPLLFVLVVAYQTFRSEGLFALGNRKALNYLGKISYGLYCFHGLVIAVLINVLRVAGVPYPPESPWIALLVFPLASLGLTVLLAHVSYRWFEHPILQMKERFR